MTWSRVLGRCQGSLVRGKRGTASLLAAAASRLARSLVVAGLMALGSQAAVAYADAPVNLAVTDVRDVGAVVSWTTTASEVGSVQYSNASGTSCAGADFSSTAPDVRGTLASTVHYVQLTPLAPSITYCFRAVSGTSVGTAMTFTTGPTLDLVAPDSVQGRVLVGGIAVTNVIVYATITAGASTSSTISALAKPGEDGHFSLELSSARTQAGLKFEYTGASALAVRADGGAVGVGTHATTVGTVPRAPITMTISPQVLSITSVTPAVVWPGGGTAITITGTGFAPGASVTLGAKSATSVLVNGTTSLTAQVPTVIVFGDVTGDGQVKVADSSCALRSALRLVEIPACPGAFMTPSLPLTVAVGGNSATASGLLSVRASDVTGDGRTSVADSSCILRQALRLVRLASCPAPAT